MLHTSEEVEVEKGGFLQTESSGSSSNKWEEVDFMKGGVVHFYRPTVLIGNLRFFKCVNINVFILSHRVLLLQVRALKLTADIGQSQPRTQPSLDLCYS